MYLIFYATKKGIYKGKKMSFPVSDLNEAVEKLVYFLLNYNYIHAAYMRIDNVGFSINYELMKAKKIARMGYDLEKRGVQINISELIKYYDNSMNENFLQDFKEVKQYLNQKKARYSRSGH